MPDKTYKIIELVGVSGESIQQAIRNAITRASESLKGLDWFEMTEVRGLVKNGQLTRVGSGTAVMAHAHREIPMAVRGDIWIRRPGITALRRSV
jgi:hypothetical protein